MKKYLNIYLKNDFFLIIIMFDILSVIYGISIILNTIIIYSLLCVLKSHFII